MYSSHWHGCAHVNNTHSLKTSFIRGFLHPLQWRACLCMCVYVCLYICVYVHLWLCVCICVCICVYVCVYTRDQNVQWDNLYFPFLFTIHFLKDFFYLYVSECGWWQRSEEGIRCLGTGVIVVISHFTWVLGTKFWPLGRLRSTLNHRAHVLQSSNSCSTCKSVTIGSVVLRHRL